MREGIAGIFESSGNLRSKLVRGSFGSLGVKGIYILTQFAVGVMLARLLGPEALGLYAFTIALVQLLVIAAQFGFPAYTVRSVALCAAQKSWLEAKGVIKGAIQLVSLLSLLIVALGLVWVSGLGLKVNGVPQHVFMTGLMLVPLLALSATNSGAVRGLGYVVIGQLPDQVVRPLVFLAFLLAIYFSGVKPSSQDALLVFGVAVFSSLVVGLAQLIKCLPKQLQQTKAEVHHRHLLKQSLPFMLLAGAQVLNYQADILMLGTLSTKNQVGLYRVALQVADGLGAALFAISVVIAPQIAQLQAHQDWFRIQRVLVYSHRAGTFIMLPAVLTIFLFSDFLLLMIFGSSFTASSTTLEILVLGKLAYAMVGFSGLALSMLGRAGMATIIALLTTILNVSMNYILIPRYGIEGAAVATISSQFVVNILAILYIAYAFRIDISVIGFKIFQKNNI